MNRFITRISICCLVAAASLKAQAPRAATTPQERLAREIYEELVEINTADSSGSWRFAAACAAKWMNSNRAGFDSRYTAGCAEAPV